jgi:hypothetical protein
MTQISDGSKKNNKNKNGCDRLYCLFVIVVVVVVDTQSIDGGGAAALLDLQRVYYTSRTHSQLSQVVRELNKTTYAR